MAPIEAIVRRTTVNPTTPRIGEQSARAGAACAWFALTFGVASALAALLAGLGYRTQLWGLSSGFLVMRWAVYVALASATVSLVALGLLTLARAARGRALAALALAVSLLVACPPLVLYQRAQSLPKIHDISTDTADPPRFVAVLPLRQGARNPADYAPGTAAQQKIGYPDIAPLRLDLPPAQAFARAERAARSMGWQIVEVAPDALRIEATDTTLLFGFKDDVVIRVRPHAQGSVVDVRSLSRIGGSDLGTNAKRVRAYLNEVAGA